MLTKRPLLDTAADQKLFVSDASRTEAETQASRLNNALIVGEPGSGKTSLLYKIRGTVNGHLPRDSPGAILLDAHLAEGASQLVDLVVQGAVDAGWISPVAMRRPDDPFAAVTQIRRLRAAPDNAMILIDDPDAEQATGLFGRLRDELWQLPVWFIVAVNPTVERSALARPPADAFFDVRTELAPLDPAAGQELLALRSGHRTPVPLPATAMQPRALLINSDPNRAVSARSDPERQYAALQAAEQIAGRTGAMLVTEIWNRGAVSASDEDLQRSLGLSRPRLTQVLTTLQDAGALMSFRDPTPGTTGRPRMLYDIPRDR